MTSLLGHMELFDELEDAVVEFSCVAPVIAVDEEMSNEEDRPQDPQSQ